MGKSRKSTRRIPLLICWILLILGAIYIARWYASRARIERETQEYQRLYRTPAPIVQWEITPSPTPTAAAEITTGPATALPSVDDRPRTTASPEPTAVETDQAGAYIYRLPTAPPIQDSFSELLNRNADTIGYLTAGDVVSLPVVWRENDNETYLDHSFSGEIAPEGALFLDGYNRLIPADDCLIIYGHNMQNGTMFGRLHLFESAAAVRNCPLISFDTIYENGLYAPFAAFRLSAETDFRKYVLDESEFADFVGQMRDRSSFSVPLDVSYGDQLLLLVTCDYDERDGRFVLALRRLRDTENASEVSALIRQAQ